MTKPGASLFGSRGKTPAERRVYLRRWRAANRAVEQGYKAKHYPVINENRRAMHAQLRAEVFQALGDKCSCGFSDHRALQIDHRYGDGASERKKLGTSSRFYRHVLANPKRYQLLCANCNWIKRYEMGESNAVRQ